MTDVERGGVGGEVEVTTIGRHHIPPPLFVYITEGGVKRGVHACSITARRNRCISLSPKM